MLDAPISQVDFHQPHSWMPIYSPQREILWQSNFRRNSTVWERTLPAEIIDFTDCLISDPANYDRMRKLHGLWLYAKVDDSINIVQGSNLADHITSWGETNKPLPLLQIFDHFTGKEKQKEALAKDMHERMRDTSKIESTQDLRCEIFTINGQGFPELHGHDHMVAATTYAGATSLLAPPEACKTSGVRSRFICTMPELITPLARGHVCSIRAGHPHSSPSPEKSGSTSAASQTKDDNNLELRLYLALFRRYRPAVHLL